MRADDARAPRPAGRRHGRFAAGAPENPVFEPAYMDSLVAIFTIDRVSALISVLKSVREKHSIFRQEFSTLSLKQAVADGVKFVFRRDSRIVGWS